MAKSPGIQYSDAADVSAEANRIRRLLRDATRSMLAETRAELDALSARCEELEREVDEANATALTALQGLASDRREMFELLTALDTSAKATA